VNVVYDLAVDDGSAIALLLDHVLEEGGLIDASLDAEFAGGRLALLRVSMQFFGVFSGRFGLLLAGLLDLCELDLSLSLVRSQF